MGAIIPGSLSAIAQSSGVSIAESFINADTIILIDVSGSMSIADAEMEGKPIARYARACAELARLQRTMAGKIAVIAFSDSATFCPGGVPTHPAGTTALAEALRFARIADDGEMRYVVVSDGEPDSEREALAEAKRYTSKISTVFVGPPGGTGEEFLQRLARASGGRAMSSHQAADLAKNVQRLLTA